VTKELRKINGEQSLRASVHPAQLYPSQLQHTRQRSPRLL